MEGRGRNRKKSYHAAEHFVLVVGEKQHHIGPPRARRRRGDPQAASQQQQQRRWAAVGQVARAAPPGHTQGQRQEPHGGQGSGGGPRAEGKDVQKAREREADEQLEKKNDCTMKAGVCGQAFSTGRDHVNRGQEAEHAVRSRDGWRGGAPDRKEEGRQQQRGKPGSGRKGVKSHRGARPALAPDSGRGWVLVGAVPGRFVQGLKWGGRSDKRRRESASRKQLRERRNVPMR